MFLPWDNKAFSLIHVDLHLEIIIEKGYLDIHSMDFKYMSCSQGNNHIDGRDLCHKSVCIEIINALLLTIVLGYKFLKLINNTICPTLS